jgi:hypothetical protein
VAFDPAPGMLGLTRKRIETIGQLTRYVRAGLFSPAAPGPLTAIVMACSCVADPVKFFGARGIVTGSAAHIISANIGCGPDSQGSYRLRGCPVYFYNEPAIRPIGQQSGFGIVDIIKIPGAGMDYHVCLKP